MPNETTLHKRLSETYFFNYINQTFKTETIFFLPFSKHQFTTAGHIVQNVEPPTICQAAKSFHEFEQFNLNVP